MNDDNVTWSTLENYAGYAVSSDGQVKVLSSDRIVRPRETKTGQLIVSLRDSEERRWTTATVGTLVASAFVEGRDASDNTVQYLDGDPTNNHASNLVWAARWHAMAYHQEIQARNTKRRLPRIVDDRKEVYQNVYEAAMATGALPSAIAYAVRYNDTQEENAKIEAYADAAMFVHRVWPSGRIFRTYR